MVADPELQSPPGTAPSPEVLRPFWTSDIQGRLDHFATIRARSGGIEYHLDAAGNDLWSLTSHQSVGQVSRDPATFTSTAGFSLGDSRPRSWR